MSTISNVSNRSAVANTEDITARQIVLNNNETLIAASDQKNLMSNLSLNETLNSKRGIENIAVRQDLIAQTTSVTGTRQITTVAQARSSAGIDLRATVADQAQFERDNHYDRAIGSRIDPQRAASTVPNGTYTEANVPQSLTVPRVNDPNILTIRPLNQLERNDIQNHTVNINRALNEVGRLLQGGLTMDEGGRVIQLSRRIDDLIARRERLWNRERLTSSAQFNGRIFNAVAEGADTSKLPVIFVNGINTDIGRSGTEALELSRRFGVPVQQIVNVNEMDRARLIGTALLDPTSATNPDRGRAVTNTEAITADITRSVLSNPIAATSTANAILNQLDNPALRGQPIKIVAYSQGGAITAEALRYVDGAMNQRVARGEISRADADRALDRIKILGLAPAAVQRDVPARFRNNYRIIYDLNDPIALGRGVDRTNNIRDLTALRDRQNNDPNFFLQHLSYFQHYEGTDPGARFNYRADIEMQRWFAGVSGARSGAVQIDINNSQFTREVTPAR